MLTDMVIVVVSCWDEIKRNEYTKMSNTQAASHSLMFDLYCSLLSISLLSDLIVRYVLSSNRVQVF